MCFQFAKNGTILLEPKLLDMIGLNEFLCKVKEKLVFFLINFSTLL